MHGYSENEVIHMQEGGRGQGRARGGGGGGSVPPLAEGRRPDHLTFLIKTNGLGSQNVGESVELLCKQRRGKRAFLVWTCLFYSSSLKVKRRCESIVYLRRAGVSVLRT